MVADIERHLFWKSLDPPLREVIDLYPILQYERQVYLNPCDFTIELLTLKNSFLSV